MIQIEHTLSFAFSNGGAKPSFEEMANFLKTLDANLGDMDTMYRTTEEKSVFLKFKSEASMLYALKHNPEQLTFHYANGKAVEVRMSVAGGNVQYVRIYGLPPEVPDNDLSLVLGKYGKVERVIREKFPSELGLNMYTGVRGVYMDVEKEIPSSLNFHNRKGNIFYLGNKDKCFVCKAEGHQMNSCPKRVVRKQQQEKKQVEGKQDESDGSSTYADVAAGGASLDNKSQETDERMEKLHEEVMKMDVAIPETKPQLSWNQQRQKRYDDLLEYERLQKIKKKEKINEVVNSNCTQKKILVPRLRKANANEPSK